MAPLRSVVRCIYEKMPVGFQLFAFFLSILFLVSLGPNLQFYTASLIGSDSASIYDSAFHGELVRFPGLEDWLKSVLDPKVLIVAFVVLLSIIKAKTPKTIFVRSLWSIFFAWCVVDLFIVLFYDGYGVQYLFICVLSNLLGGLVFATVLTAILSGLDLYISNFPGGRLSGLFFLGFWAVFSSLLLCCAAYYLASFFFKPLPVRIQLYAIPDTKGYVRTANSEPPEKNSNRNQKLALIPSNSVRSRFLITSIGEEGELSFDANSEYQDYSLRVVPVGGCFELDNALSKVTDAEGFGFEEVSSFKVRFDEGVSTVTSGESEKKMSSGGLQADSFSAYQYEVDDVNEGFKMSQTFTDNIAMHYSAVAGKQVFLVGSYLAEKSESFVSPKRREFVLEVDGKSQNFSFDPSYFENESNELTCKVLGEAKKSSSSSVLSHSYSSSSPYAGLVIIVEPNWDEKSGRFYTDELKVSVKAGGGYRVVDRIDVGKLVYSDPDKITMFTLSGNVERVLVNGEKKAVSETDRYAALGDFTATYTGRSQ